MSDASKIEWTDATWNPVTGCTKVSAGCDHCYAERVTERFHGKGSFETVVLHPDRLEQPLRWRRPRRIFVNSMSDLFHDDVPDEFIDDVWGVMAALPQHTYQILTKRHARMRSWVGRWCSPSVLPLPNVWLGVSVEDQHWADIRIPALLDTPAAVRFLSCEPLLGPVDLTTLATHTRGPVAHWEGKDQLNALTGRPRDPKWRTRPGIDWVIVGGESGPGARPMQLRWARDLRDQCVNAGVPFHFKQWGEWLTTLGQPIRVGKKAAGRELDGRTWDEFPQPLVGAS